MKLQRLAKVIAVKASRIERSRRVATRRLTWQALRLPFARPVYDTIGYTAVALHTLNLLGIDVEEKNHHFQWHAEALLSIFLAKLAARHARKLMQTLTNTKNK